MNVSRKVGETVGIRDTLSQIVSNRTETREAHVNDALKTHYYKTSKDKAMTAVESVLHGQGYTVKTSEKDRGEIIATSKKGKKSFLVATVVMVRPFRTAVDFSCSTDTMLPLDFGYSKKQIIRLYEALDRELTYIGSGLGNELL